MPPRKRTKIIKVLFFTVLSIFLIFVLIQISANIYIKNLFNKNITNIEKRISDIYKIEYESISVNILNRSLTLKNLRIIPKDEKIKKIDKGNFDKSKLFEFHLPTLKVTGIKLFKAILHNSLFVRNVLIEKGQLKVMNIRSSVEDNTVKNLEKDIFVLKSFPFTQIGIDEVKINNFLVESSHIGLKTLKAKIFEVSFKLTGLQVKLKKIKNQTSKLRFDCFQTVVEDLEILFPGRMYSLSVEKIVISEPLSRIKINSLKLKPGYKKYAFSRQMGYRITRIDVEVDKLNFYNLSLKDIFKQGCFKSDLLNVNGARIHFFRDRRLPRRLKLWPKKFPQEVFRELKLCLEIKKIKISAGYFSYEEHGIGFRKPGKIDFKDVNIIAENISNHPNTLRKGLPLTVNVSSYFLGKSLFKASFNIPVYDKNNSFYFTGSLERMKLAHLNSILKNSFLKVERGTVKRLFFYAWGNRYIARGTLKLFYNDLKISVFKKRQKIKRDSAASFVANKFLKNDNPKRGKSLRIGYMHHIRRQSDSILKLIWKSFLSGIKSSVGL